jgi:hypothetical protein
MVGLHEQRKGRAMLPLVCCGACPPSWPRLPSPELPDPFCCLLPACPPSLNPEFIKAQWTVCDQEYDVPAMRWCQKIKCNLAITKAQLHDALVNVSWRA